MKPSTSNPLDSFSFANAGPTFGLPLPVEPDWLWRGYLAGGQLTLLTSLWKSGKTTLLWLLLSRMKEGGELLGLPVRPGKAVVLSEENLLHWRMRHQRLPLADHAQLVCRPFKAKPARAEWEAAVEAAGRLLGTEGSRLLVIDTVASLMPAGVEANADCMLRALAPLRGLSEQGVAVWLMHHPHKGVRRAGQWARGTGSLPGEADISVEMHHVSSDSHSDRRRLLVGLSRFEATPRRRFVEWDPATSDYLVLPETLDPEFDRGLSVILRLLADCHDPQPATAILADWPADADRPSRATLQRWLARAVERGLLACEESERKNVPHLYWVVEGEEG